MVKRKCLDCGIEFEAVNMGPSTRRYCDNCAKIREALEEKKTIKAQSEIIQSQFQNLVASAQIPPIWRDINFENSDPKRYDTAFQKAQEYAISFHPRVSSSFVLWCNQIRIGKTHLAICIANYVLHEHKYSVLFRKAASLRLDIQKAYSSREEDSEGEILDKLLSPELLIIDDLGVDNPTRWLQGIFYMIFDRILESQKPVVVTTNFQPTSKMGAEALVTRIGLKAQSRLIDMCQGNIVEVTS